MNRIQMSALAVTYNPNTFGDILSMGAFNDQAYSNIVSNDGTIIIQPDSEIVEEFGYNILNSIEASGSLTKQGMQALREDMDAKQKG